MNLRARLTRLERRAGLTDLPDGPYRIETKPPFDYAGFASDIEELWPALGAAEDESNGLWDS